MKKSVDYRGFTVMAKPILLESGEWNTVVQVKRDGAVKLFYAKDTWKSEEEAVRQSLWLGMRIIDGEVPEFNAGDLP